MKETDELKDFDAVKYFREIKTKISEEIKDMTYEQLQEYLAKDNSFATKD